MTSDADIHSWIDDNYRDEMADWSFSQWVNAFYSGARADVARKYYNKHYKNVEEEERPIKEDGFFKVPIASFFAFIDRERMSASPEVKSFLSRLIRWMDV